MLLQKYRRELSRKQAKSNLALGRVFTRATEYSWHSLGTHTRYSHRLFLLRRSCNDVIGFQKPYSATYCSLINSNNAVLFFSVDFLNFSLLTFKTETFQVSIPFEFEFMHGRRSVKRGVSFLIQILALVLVLVLSYENVIIVDAFDFRIGSLLLLKHFRLLSNFNLPSILIFLPQTRYTNIPRLCFYRLLHTLPTDTRTVYFY